MKIPKVLVLVGRNNYRGTRKDWERVADYMQWAGMVLAANAIRDYVEVIPERRVLAGVQPITIEFRNPEILKIERFLR